MSHFDWQQIAVVLAMIAAAAHIGRRAYRLWRPTSGARAGSCGDCSAGAGRCSTDKAGLVPLAALQLPARPVGEAEQANGS